MKRTIFLPFLLLLFYTTLFGIEQDSSYVSPTKLYYNYVLNTALDGYLDEWMQNTYGLNPVIGFEFSTNVSPTFDGVIEFSVSRNRGSYNYYWYDINHQDFTFLYEKIGLGVRICDRRLIKRTAFLEGGLDAIHAKEWNEVYSKSGDAIGCHIAAGFWGNIQRNWIVQVKGKMQFLAIPMRTDHYYTDHYYSSYEMDFSGVGISIGFGLSK